MKNKSFLMFILAASMASCINDAEVISESNVTNESGSVQTEGVSFRFIIPNVSSGSTRTVDDSGIHDNGSPEEYALHNVNLYLFNSETGNFYNSYAVENLQLVSTGDSGASYSCNSIVIEPGTYRIFAIANADISIIEPSTIDNLLSSVSSLSSGELGSVPSSGFIMTNRGNQSPVVTIQTDAHASASITLERTVAKLMLRSSSDTYQLLDKSGLPYADIKPANYSFVNLSKDYYLFRHVATLADDYETPAPITYWSLDDNNFDVIPSTNGYAIDPHFFEKTVAGAATFDGNTIFTNPISAAESLSFSGTFPTAASGQYSSFYALGNCAFRPAQLQGYMTGAVIKCNMTPYANRCFDENGNQADINNYNTLYYFNYNFYTSLLAVKNIGKGNIPSGSNPSDEVLATFNIKKFTKSQGSYNCYYNYWIKHLDNGLPTTMGVMEYAVVRNNMYRITITNIRGLGDGTPNTDPVVPVEEDGYLDTDYNVNPWIVRDDSNVELG